MFDCNDIAEQIKYLEIAFIRSYITAYLEMLIKTFCSSDQQINRDYIQDVNLAGLNVNLQANENPIHNIIEKQDNRFPKRHKNLYYLD